jgi:hypothetical protein
MNTKSVNENFFDKDKESRAMWYVLGLSYSRYSASSTDNRNSWYSSNFKVLKIIKKELKSKHKISKPNSNGNRILQIRSQSLQDKLTERGLGVPKNQREFPKNCGTEYLDYFVRGFFDGIVSCSTRLRVSKVKGWKTESKQLLIYYNEPFLKKLYNVLILEAGIRKGRKIKNSRLKITDSDDITAIYDFIYGNFNYVKSRGLYLPNKKDRFEI